ncbi:CAP-associated domain-containing protein [Psychrobacillus sp.]|uniref:CAP domain-containing protein n=1 Tax=Psychrobacillus sp. TaxID=1871623 RepID=UPI0028BE2B18|nr:CAP-associated domain-containing protein [Psychrobacillus sp.]
MKNLLKILVIVAIVLVVFIYLDNPVQENELLKGSNNAGQIIPEEVSKMVESDSIFTRPKTGSSTLIGQPSSEAIEMLGKPTRIEPSMYGYEWWVYNSSFSTYQLVGVSEGIVTQVFAFGTGTNVTPYEIGQSIEDIYRFTIIQSEITISIDSNTYTFSLNEEDINKRILVQFEDLFAMLYIDVKDKQLEAVRFTDPKTLLLHKPYDIFYNGAMIDTTTPTSSLQVAVDRANERQIVEISNVYRFKHGLSVLESDFVIQQIARSHSEEMAKNNVVINDTFEVTKFSDKLNESSVVFERAGGNTAAFYLDAGEAVNGWLNSKNHRDTLLGKWYSHIGVGVYGNYYTQNFIERPFQKEQKE